MLGWSFTFAARLRRRTDRFAISTCLTIIQWIAVPFHMTMLEKFILDRKISQNLILLPQLLQGFNLVVLDFSKSIFIANLAKLSDVSAIGFPNASDGLHILLLCVRASSIFEEHIMVFLLVWIPSISPFKRFLHFVSRLIGVSLRLSHFLN